jgi:hypothetical protein
MAKFTPILGNISGKLAGSVFAFNRAGFYLRSFRSPVMPNSLPQLRARALFTAAVSAWHALTNVTKGEWNSFAASFFKSKHPVTGVSYSGYNAFVSMRNQALNLIAQVADNPPTILMPALVTLTAGTFEVADRPPGHALSSSIRDCEGLPLGIQLVAFMCTSQGQTCTADFNLIGNFGVGTGDEGPNFIDSIGGEDVGIAIYISKPTQQDTQYVSNPEHTLLTIIAPLGQLEDWTSSHVLSIESECTKNFIYANQQPFTQVTMQATAYLVSKSGQSQPIGVAKFAWPELQ